MNLPLVPPACLMILVARAVWPVLGNEVRLQRDGQGCCEASPAIRVKCTRS